MGHGRQDMLQDSRALSGAAGPGAARVQAVKATGERKATEMAFYLGGAI